MDSILCVLLPQRDATPEQLNALGTALVKWLDKEQEAGIAALWATAGVDDLLEGEMPQPLAIRKAKEVKPPPEDRGMKQVLDEAIRMTDLPPKNGRGWRPRAGLLFQEPSSGRSKS